MTLNKRAFPLWLLVLLVHTCSVCGQTARSAVQASLLGTWTLVSTEELLRDGHRRPYTDLGPHATGYLMYAADGHMCATLMRTGRSPWKHDEEHATAEEKLSAADGFTSYCGTYKVNEKEMLITHLPEVSFLPNYVGVPQIRPYTLEGNRLTFSGTETEGEVVRWTIVWQRASP